MRQLFHKSYKTKAGQTLKFEETQLIRDPRGIKCGIVFRVRTEGCFNQEMHATGILRNEPQVGGEEGFKSGVVATFNEAVQRFVTENAGSKDEKMSNAKVTCVHLCSFFFTKASAHATQMHKVHIKSPLVLLLGFCFSTETRVFGFRVEGLGLRRGHRYPRALTSGEGIARSMRG